jgi:DNA-binding response OmpR family regulator
MSTPANEKLSLLIIERDPAARGALVTAAAQTELFDPVEALEDGDVALEFLWSALEAEGERPPDIIVSALWLPRLNGIQLAIELRSHAATREMFIALLAPRDHPLDRSAAETAGCNVFLVWPHSVEEAAAMLRELAEKFLRV